MKNQLELTKEFKVLLITVLKQNEITDLQANQIIDYLVNNELIEQVRIKFVNFSENEK